MSSLPQNRTHPEKAPKAIAVLNGRSRYSWREGAIAYPFHTLKAARRFTEEVTRSNPTLEFYIYRLAEAAPQTTAASKLRS